MMPRPPRRAPSAARVPEAKRILITAPRELVVVMNDGVDLRVAPAGLASASGADVAPLAKVLAGEKAALRPLFGLPEERLRYRAMARADERSEAQPDLATYYQVDAPSARLDGIAEALRAQPTVRAAYVKPPAELPMRVGAAALPLAAEAPPASPDFSARQGYLDAAPGGVDARHAWTRPGGRGTDVRIIDIEGAWRFSHEDLKLNQGGIVAGAPPNDPVWVNHGTAVVGVFGGDGNSFGVTGICPDADVRAISVFGSTGSAAAIRMAADLLQPGDILLIELHRAGPRFAYQLRPDQRGYIPIEWWPDDYDAIRYAIGRGVIVVEAAGNGGEDLDDPIYQLPAPGFPAGWSNPFARGGRDSGAILVGAGAPPPGTHGADHGPDRSRLDFSNYGAAVDAQGWGVEVTTCGYGDLQGGSNEDFWYTDTFNGTSSASPVVVGALGCVQGVLRAAQRPTLTPQAARGLLRSTGSAQQDAPGRPASQRIGHRPDVRALLGAVMPQAATGVPLHRYWNVGLGDHFYTTDWAELGNGGWGWVYEGIACHVYAAPAPGVPPPPNSQPLHRYWNGEIANHFYTTNFAELGAGRDGWVYERVECHVPAQAGAGTVPLYRYFNAALTDHFYTTEWGELGYGRFGYELEGIQCQVFGGPQAVPSIGEVPAAASVPEVAAPADFALRPLPGSFRRAGAPAAAGAVAPASFRAAPAGSGGVTIIVQR
jgi:hypothetical protein